MYWWVLSGSTLWGYKNKRRIGHNGRLNHYADTLSHWELWIEMISQSYSTLRQDIWVLIPYINLSMYACYTLGREKWSCLWVFSIKNNSQRDLNLQHKVNNILCRWRNKHLSTKRVSGLGATIFTTILPSQCSSSFSWVARTVFLSYRLDSFWGNFVNNDINRATLKQREWPCQRNCLACLMPLYTLTP